MIKLIATSAKPKYFNLCFFCQPFSPEQVVSSLHNCFYEVSGAMCLLFHVGIDCSLKFKHRFWAIKTLWKFLQKSFIFSCFPMFRLFAEAEFHLKLNFLISQKFIELSHTNFHLFYFVHLLDINLILIARHFESANMRIGKMLSSSPRHKPTSHSVLDISH